MPGDFPIRAGVFVEGDGLDGDGGGREVGEVFAQAGGGAGDDGFVEKAAAPSEVGMEDRVAQAREVGISET